MRSLGAFGGGVTVGLTTLWLQGVLPGAWNHLANSGAIWCLAAYAAGALLRSQLLRSQQEQAVVVGTVTLFGAVIGYYAGATVFLGDDVSAAALRWPMIWLTVALVAGPVFGLAGAAYRSPSRMQRLLSVLAVGAVFIAEAGYLLIGLAYRSEAGIMLLLGLTLPIALLCAAKPSPISSGAGTI